MLFHVLAHSRVPKGLLTWLNRRIRSFLWKHSSEVRKWHYIGWDLFTASRSVGGAGVLDIIAWHEALTLAIRVLTEPELGSAG